MAFPGLSPDDYIIDGELTGYFDRRKFFVANYKNGVLDGPFTEFFASTGIIRSKVNVTNGIKNGAYQKFLREGQSISGNYADDKMSGEWKIFGKDSSLIAVFNYDQGNNTSIMGNWKSSSGYSFEFLKDGNYILTNGDKKMNGRYDCKDDLIELTLNGDVSYYRIINFSSDQLKIKGAAPEVESVMDFSPRIDPNEYTMTRLYQK
jgi:antitoxin component YwqK of YwqJK toxin-antitoxin module